MSLGSLVRLVDHAGESCGVCAVLHLDALPLEPAEVDRHRRCSYQNDHNDRQHRQDGSSLC